MTGLVIGVIGHVDHGKTALVRALTGMETDRLPEEKKRGISIALGFAHLKLESGAGIDFIDMPGHERFIRTMVSGATGMDAVLLIVAANEGVCAQTIEHIHIASLLGLRRAVVAITKSDLTSADQAALVADDVMELLARAELQASPPVTVSALQGDGVDALRQALAALARDHTADNADGVAYLPIDRAFNMSGHGPVITGTLRGAAVKAGETLELLPARKVVRVRSVQVHGARVTRAEPGQRVALNLRDVELSDLKRGMALTTPDALALSNWLTISLHVVERAPPLKNGVRVSALFGADEAEARLRLLDRDAIEAGQSGFAQLQFAEPIGIPAREHVILRRVSPQQTVAGGRVLEPETQRLRRKDASVLDRLEALRTLPPAGLIADEIERAGAAGVTLRRLGQLSGFGATRVLDALRSLPVVVTRAGSVLRSSDVDDLAAQIPELLAVHHDGLSHEALAAALPKYSVVSLEAGLERLLASRTLVKRGTLFAIPRPEAARARASAEAELAGRIAERLREEGLSPAAPDEILTDLHAQRAIDRLVREGVIIRAVDRAKNREVFFHRDAVEDAQRRLAPLLERVPGLLVTEIGAALGISRKYSMPLLDHLDAIRFTRRIKDRRILGVTSSSVR